MSDRLFTAAFTRNELAHIVTAVTDHVRYASLVDEALYDLALTDAPPDDARITCGECGTAWATIGEYARAVYELTAADGVPADAWWGQCTRCPKDVL